MLFLSFHIFCNLFHVIIRIGFHPAVFGPDFNPASNSHQDSILLDAGKIPQNSRKEDPSLLVYFTSGGASQKKAGELTGVCICQGQGVKLFFQGFPFGIFIHK